MLGCHRSAKTHQLGSQLYVIAECSQTLEAQKQSALDAGMVGHAEDTPELRQLSEDACCLQNLDSDVKRALKECLNGSDVERRACVYRVRAVLQQLPKQGH